jgi:SAM-dependent methyltransferase
LPVSFSTEPSFMQTEPLGHHFGDHVRRLYIARPMLVITRALWRRLPPDLQRFRPVLRLGQFLHRIVLMRNAGIRWQNPGTHFVRNRAELAFLARLVGNLPPKAPFSVAMLGASVGAEATSMAWAMVAARPDIALDIHASDIDPTVIEIARGGVYQADTREFLLIEEAEIQALFEPGHEGGYKVRDVWRKPIHWHVFDATRPDIVAEIGERDLVIANRFLCHMQGAAARVTLRNIIRLVKPGGILLVSGVDLDVRGDVTREAGLIPIDDHFDDLYNGDPTLRRGWPLQYWGVEPLDRTHSNWRYRCGTAFKKPVDAN